MRGVNCREGVDGADGEWEVREAGAERGTTLLGGGIERNAGLLGRILGKGVWGISRDAEDVGWLFSMMDQ